MVIRVDPVLQVIGDADFGNRCLQDRSEVELLHLRDVVRILGREIALGIVDFRLDGFCKLEPSARSCSVDIE